MGDRLPRASDKNLDYDEGINLSCGIANFDAVGSVACLECCWRDNGSRVYVLAGT
ncbi:MAG: hypothetical protein GX227_08800 [Clostridiaceae bacterium]|nr:hypothetical protein [Clostridiaceae bacterium]